MRLTKLHIEQTLRRKCSVADAKKKMTILDFKKFKDEGRKFAYCTAYDYTTATVVDESDVEIILVGDSLE